MIHLSSAAHRMFAAQHGIASTRQLVAAGHSIRQIKRLSSAGVIIAVIRGAYRTPSVNLDELGRCAAVCLSHPDVAIAGPTAGRLWDLRRLPHDRRIHVISPPHSNPAIAKWVVPYRTGAIRPTDIIDRGDGIRVSTRARTALDLARWLDADDLLSVVEQVLHDGRLHETALRDVAINWMSPRRPWLKEFVHLLDRRLPGGPAESHPEVVFAEALRLAGVQGLVRQFRVELAGFGAVRFDLAIPPLQWAVELDIHPTHDETSGVLADHRRDRAATANGWTVKRVSKVMYEHHFADAVAGAASQYVELRSAAHVSR